MRIQELFKREVLLEGVCPGEHNFRAQIIPVDHKDVKDYGLDYPLRLDPHLQCRREQRHVNLWAILHGVLEAFKLDKSKFTNLPETTKADQGPEFWKERHLYLQLSAYPLKIVIQKLKLNGKLYYNIRSVYPEERTSQIDLSKKIFVDTSHSGHRPTVVKHALPKIKGQLLTYTDGAWTRLKYKPAEPRSENYTSAQEYERIKKNYEDMATERRSREISHNTIESIINNFNSSSNSLPSENQFYLKLTKSPITIGIKKSPVQGYEIFSVGLNTFDPDRGIKIIVLDPQASQQHKPGSQTFKAQPSAADRMKYASATWESALLEYHEKKI